MSCGMTCPIRSDAFDDGNSCRSCGNSTFFGTSDPAPKFFDGGPGAPDWCRYGKDVTPLQVLLGMTLSLVAGLVALWFCAIGVGWMVDRLAPSHIPGGVLGCALALVALGVASGSLRRASRFSDGVHLLPIAGMIVSALALLVVYFAVRDAAGALFPAASSWWAAPFAVGMMAALNFRHLGGVVGVVAFGCLALASPDLVPLRDDAVALVWFLMPLYHLPALLVGRQRITLSGLSDGMMVAINITCLVVGVALLGLEGFASLVATAVGQVF